MLPDSIELLSLDQVGIYEEIPENEATIHENAISKARYVTDNYKLNCFADDSGLEVDVLNDEPGVFSARYAGPEKNDQANTELLLQKLHGQNKRSARFRTVIALIIDGKLNTFEGIINGDIASKPTGDNGFGYDPVFIPRGEMRSFAEMETTEKNQMSHRAKAFSKMTNFLNTEFSDKA